MKLIHNILLQIQVLNKMLIMWAYEALILQIFFYDVSDTGWIRYRYAKKVSDT